MVDVKNRVQEYPIKNTQGGGLKKVLSSVSGIEEFLKQVEEGKAKARDTLVFEDSALGHGFTQIPNQVLKDVRLSASNKVLYSLLLMYAWKAERCFPGKVTLAQLMGCDIRTVSRSMARLKAVGLIKIERRGLGKVNIYHLCRLSEAYPQMVDKGARG